MSHLFPKHNLVLNRNYNLTYSFLFHLKNTITQWLFALFLLLLSQHFNYAFSKKLYFLINDCGFLKLHSIEN